MSELRVRGRVHAIGRMKMMVDRRMLTTVNVGNRLLAVDLNTAPYCATARDSRPYSMSSGRAPLAGWNKACPEPAVRLLRICVEAAQEATGRVLAVGGEAGREI